MKKTVIILGILFITFAVKSLAANDDVPDYAYDVFGVLTQALLPMQILHLDLNFRYLDEN